MTDEEWVSSVRTIEQAREFILKVGVCGILHDPKGAPSLWDAVDAPDKQPSEKGWGKKMELVWKWKNEIPARYPEEIYYGKRKGGAMLCTMQALRPLYQAQYRTSENLSETARKLLSFIAQAPLNNKELKQLTLMTGKENKSGFDCALMELQLAFQIVRVNCAEPGDTWTLFSLQYPNFAK